MFNITECALGGCIGHTPLVLYNLIQSSSLLPLIFMKCYFSLAMSLVKESKTILYKLRAIITHLPVVKHSKMAVSPATTSSLLDGRIANSVALYNIALPAAEVASILNTNS